jgi:hypothetical protein
MAKAPCGGGDSPSWYDDKPLGDWEKEQRVKRAAARLRLVTDSRLGRETPEWVQALAAEEPGSCPDPGEKIRRAAHAASEKASRHRILVAIARLRVTLDQRLGRKTDTAWVMLAQEDL